MGIRLSPAMPLGGINEGDTESVRAQYQHLVGELATLNLAYLHLHHAGDDELLSSLRDIWPTAVLVVRYGRNREQIADDVAAGLADVAPLGRYALANPDIVERLRSNAPLNEVDPSTLYGGGATGYTDYPALAHAQSRTIHADRRGCNQHKKVLEMHSLNGAVVLVTGANGGIGTHFVHGALARGASKVYATARTPCTWEDERIVPLTLDITDPASIRAAVEAAGDVTVLINDAGASVATPGILTHTDAEIRTNVETNFLGRLPRHGDGCACHRPQDGPGRSGHHGIWCRRSRRVRGSRRRDVRAAQGGTQRPHGGALPPTCAQQVLETAAAPW